MTGRPWAIASWHHQRARSPRRPVLRWTNTSAADMRRARALGVTSKGLSSTITRSPTPAARASRRRSATNERSTTAPESSSRACGSRSTTSFQRTTRACRSPLVPGLRREKVRNTRSRVVEAQAAAGLLAQGGRALVGLDVDAVGDDGGLAQAGAGEARSGPTSPRRCGGTGASAARDLKMKPSVGRTAPLASESSRLDHCRLAWAVPTLQIDRRPVVPGAQQVGRGQDLLAVGDVDGGVALAGRRAAAACRTRWWAGVPGSTRSLSTVGRRWPSRYRCKRGVAVLLGQRLADQVGGLVGAVGLVVLRLLEALDQRQRAALVGRRAGDRAAGGRGAGAGRGPRRRPRARRAAGAGGRPRCLASRALRPGGTTAVVAGLVVDPQVVLPGGRAALGALPVEQARHREIDARGPRQPAGPPGEGCSPTAPGSRWPAGCGSPRAALPDRTSAPK